MNDQKNMLLAIVLSAIVLIGWQVFFGIPQMQQQQQQKQQKQKQQQQQQQQQVKLYGTVVKTLVIDGGNDCYGVALRRYLADIGSIEDLESRKKLREDTLELLVTHYHDDHQDGLRSMMRDPPKEQGKPTVEKVRPAKFYHVAGKQQSGPGTGRIAKIFEELNGQNTKSEKKTALVPVPRGGRDDGSQPFAIPLGFINNIPVICRILASDLAVLATNGREEVPRRKVKSKEKIDQNDRSTVLVVEYGSFRHFIGGDAGGSLGKAYANVEAKLAPAMPLVLAKPSSKGARFKTPAHCCAMKLNHHGTRFSNDEHFLATVRPRLALIPAGVMAMPHGHPMPETVTRLIDNAWSSRLDGAKDDMSTDVANTLQKFTRNATTTQDKGSLSANQTTTLNQYPQDHFAIFATEVAANKRNKKGGKLAPFVPDPNDRIPILGNIVVRPVDEDVQSLETANASKPLRIQVYGDLEFTPIQDRGDYRLKPGVNPSGGMYPSGGLVVTCDQH
jgi:type II secretory pathway pseudopilin PulG